MPASLRRACHACISAKRRCDPQLPKCSRCLKNGLACAYDNEPLSHVKSLEEQVLPDGEHGESHGSRPEVPAQPNFLVFNDIISAEKAARELFDAQSRDQHLSIPEIRVVPDPDVLFSAVSQIANIPKAILEGHSSPFVHSQLHRERHEDSARMEQVLLLQRSISENTPSGIKSPLQNTHLQDLMRINILELPLTDTLIHLHELFLYIIIYSCNNLPPRYMSETRSCLETLLLWTEHLWTTAQKQETRPNCQWQSWLVAESVRRSIIACALIKGAANITSSGYSVYQPFLEALPFDPRNELWEAMTEDAWNSAVLMHDGEPEVMISFHEFIQGYRDISEIKNEGMFQRLLLIMYYGRKALEALDSI